QHLARASRKLHVLRLLLFEFMGEGDRCEQQSLGRDGLAGRNDGPQAIVDNRSEAAQVAFGRRRHHAVGLTTDAKLHRLGLHHRYAITLSRGWKWLRALHPWGHLEEDIGRTTVRRSAQEPNGHLGERALHPFAFSVEPRRTRSTRPFRHVAA